MFLLCIVSCYNQLTDKIPGTSNYVHIALPLCCPKTVYTEFDIEHRKSNMTPGPMPKVILN